MAQRFVMKDRSKTADGHKEMSKMIRDPRQKVANSQFDAKTRKTSKSKLLKMDAKKKNKRKAISLDDHGVKTRLMKKRIVTESKKS